MTVELEVVICFSEIPFLLHFTNGEISLDSTGFREDYSLQYFWTVWQQHWPQKSRRKELSHSLSPFVPYSFQAVLKY